MSETERAELRRYLRARLADAEQRRDDRRAARAAARDSLTVAHTRRMLDSAESEVTHLRRELERYR